MCAHVESNVRVGAPQWDRRSLFQLIDNSMVGPLQAKEGEVGQGLIVISVHINSYIHET